MGSTTGSRSANYTISQDFNVLFITSRKISDDTNMEIRGNKERKIVLFILLTLAAKQLYPMAN